MLHRWITSKKKKICSLASSLMKLVGVCYENIKFDLFALNFNMVAKYGVLTIIMLLVNLKGGVSRSGCIINPLLFIN